jgi:hypothetical protein
LSRFPADNLGYSSILLGSIERLQIVAVEDNRLWLKPTHFATPKGTCLSISVDRPNKMISKLDKHITNSLAFRLWQICSGMVMLALIPIFLGSVEQGYYFTFGSIVALQMFFELGLNNIIVQFVAHSSSEIERATAAGETLAVEQARQGLSAIVSVCTTWYRLAAAGFLIVATTAGFIYFKTYSNQSQIAWHLPWVILCAATSANLALSPYLSFLEGRGLVSDVAAMRLRQAVLGSVIAWILLLTGNGLVAVIAVPTTSALYTAFWLKTQKLVKEQFGNHRAIPFAQTFRFWKKEVFPLQTRMSLSWFSGYFAYQLFVPTAFAVYGAKSAGQLGLALTASNAIVGLSMAWINAKSPEIARKLAAYNISEAKHVFGRHASLSSGLNMACWVVVLLGQTLVLMTNWKIQEKFPSLGQTAVIAANAFLSHVAFSFSTYFRAHKHEPTTPVALVQAILVASLLQFCSHLTLTQTLTLNLMITALVVLPGTLYIYRRDYVQYAT